MSERNSQSISEIHLLEEQLLASMRSKDINFLDNIFSEKYIFFGSDGSLWGKDKALADYRNQKFCLDRIEISDRQIIMHDATAIITGISLVEGQIDKISLTGEYRFMRVWGKEGAKWKIIAVTTSAMP